MSAAATVPGAESSGPTPAPSTSSYIEDPLDLHVLEHLGENEALDSNIS